VFSDMAGVLRRGRWWLPAIGLSTLVGTLVTLALPAVLGRALDAVIAAGGGLAAGDATGVPAGMPMGGATGWVATAGLLIALGLAIDLLDTVLVAGCVADTAAWLRRRLVEHVLAIGPRGSGRFGTGDIVGRISGNAADAARAGPGLVTAVAAVAPPVGGLVLLALIDLGVAAAFLVGLVLSALVLRAFTRHTADAIGSYLVVQGRIAARLAESLAGSHTIAAAGTLDREVRRVLEPLPELRAEGERAWRVLSRSGAQAAVVGPLVLLAVLAAGGYALSAGRITPGELFAAGQYAALGAGLGGLTGVFGRLARARAGLRRTGEVLRVSEVEYGRRDLPPGPGRLEFRGVVVTDRLERVDLVVPGGACVAVVGRSGAGKSTLVALAARLGDPDGGAVLLDGVPMTELTRDALRAAVGCAFERPVLVGGTVADAIGLGLDAERVRAAARATRADEFIARLPNGYDTPLAETPLSGGEAQRLGLARAWPAGRVLLLDDATSALDMVTEMTVDRALAEPMVSGARTRLVVTHRAAVAARADLVAWLAGGRLRGLGRHRDLWTDPEYRELFA
jgi:ATP-binding cassette, subfamily B, bacterial